MKMAEDEENTQTRTHVLKIEIWTFEINHCFKLWIFEQNGIQIVLLICFGSTLDLDLKILTETLISIAIFGLDLGFWNFDLIFELLDLIWDFEILI